MRQLFILLSLVFSLNGLAQDNSNVLTYEAFLQQVMENHPYAYRASIVQSMGKSQVTEARGAFDPKLFGNMDQKYFEDKQYYSHIAGGVKIPTWFGFSAEIGYTQNGGAYLNPEQRIPDAGLWYAGVRLELGNGLLIDQRRAELEKAKLYRTSSALERTILLNELRRNASNAYWKWQQSYEQMIVYQLAYENSLLRFNAVKDAALFGDRPFIDTLEASITVQNRLLSLRKANNSLENAELGLEFYLWAEGFVPLELENIVPETTHLLPDALPLVQLDTLISGHPYVQINDLQLLQKRVDLQLKREQLKPKLTLKYNAISEPLNGNPAANYSPANYTWGATFAYPLLSRKERGGVQLAKLKLQDQELKNTANVAEIRYKVGTALNNYLLALDQLETSRQLVESSEAMYNAERSLFDLGESSVFMINSRESTWLKSRIELIELENQSKMLYNELLFQLMADPDPVP